jgi:hypothetical protein
LTIVLARGRCWAPERQRLAVHPDVAAVHSLGDHEQSQDRRLPGPTGADERDTLSCRHVEVQVENFAKQDLQGTPAAVLDSESTPRCCTTPEALGALLRA